MSSRICRVGCLAVFGLLSVVSPAFSQSDNPTNAGVQFDFSLPGARSLGLGGAFVGVADDATAAWSNPAGLLILTKPEISIEGRGWQFANTGAQRGHAFGPASGVGYDTVTGITPGTFEDWSGAPSFVSFVYPTSRFAVAGYRHQVQRFRAHLEADGLFIQTTSPTPIFANGAIDRDSPFRGELAIDVANYGGAFAARLGGGFSAGISVAVSVFSLESQTTAYTYDPFNNFNGANPPSAYRGTGQYYGAPDFSAGRVYTNTVEEGDETAVAVSAGALWRASDGRLSIGGAYRQGPTFHYQATTTFGPGIVGAGGFADEGDVLDTEEIEYGVPHVFSLGVGVRPVSHILLSGEYNFVQYSRLSENTAEIFGVEESPFPGEKEKGQLIRESLFVEDANQLRFGVEYSIVNQSSVVALRFGLWNDPNHRMEFARDDLTPEQRASIARVDARYLEGEDDIHWSAGAGFSLSGFQIDGAVDIGSAVKTISISSVFRF